MTTLNLRKELMTIKGVGPYAAANLLMLLGRHDFIPIDSWALMLVSHEWHKGKPVTAREVEKRFEKWGEYKGLAFWFWDWKYNGG
jgi:3-methyladenine DNA glycosylase/8-oxoguanine DNA glycosylase